MATLRTGSFGEYYGSLQGESSVLEQGQMYMNGKYIYSYLKNKGWSINAISALLGNMQAESSLNPGRWQNDNTSNINLGYGLVQWTPSTKYTEWAIASGFSDPSEMDSNLSRILYELENNIQWIATSSYDYSFKEFSTSEDSFSNLAKAFLLNYERPADQSEAVQTYRASLASHWYEYITGITPSDPSGPTTKNKRKKYNFMLFQANRRRNQWIKNR